MEENLFYEVQNIHVASEVRAAYENAKARNVKYYRCRSYRGGLYYGWVGGKHVKADSDSYKKHREEMARINGEYWFINKAYQAQPETAAESLVLGAVAETIDLTVEAPAVVAAPIITPKEPEVNYKALYEAQKETLSVKTKEYEIAKNSLVKAREAQAKTLEKLEEVQETLKELSEDVDELKDDINDIKYINLE